jgi:hypothetical protein
VASDGFGNWSGGDVAMVLFCGGFVGGGAALYDWYKTNRADTVRRDEDRS